jgi:hypothetical protein
MLPPMFSRSIAMPAVCCRMTHGSRADGMLCSCSSVKVCFGAGLLGVDDRALARDRHRFLHRAETPSCVLTFRVEADVTWMPSLTTVLKPCSRTSAIGADVSAGNWKTGSLVVATCGCSSEGRSA